MPSIINFDLDIWLFHPREIKFLMFVMNFASDSVIGDKGHPLPDDTPLTEHKLCLVSGQLLVLIKFLSLTLRNLT